MPLVAPVVVVDDNQDDIDLTLLLLRKAGVATPTIFTGGDGLKAGLALLGIPRVVFLDVKMPGMTGHDVLAWLRSHTDFDAVPVVMWSSSDDPHDIRVARENRAQCYVAKYPTVSALAELLREADEFRAGLAAPHFQSRSNLLNVRETPIPSFG